ncbi:DUF4097 family beta strand repeat-containing protein [Nonomuraea sp. SBT364]|uniref:DUF4097 family beta strand repeat-containing protein n=1 Tax=Nonomuraea sp. SBT364 TaxID=1580530 RepID=UPI00066BF80F|nr:DUF4097 family beta strand repeat-containing protein [Nonomuraea sp. SBT364]
MRAAWLVVGSVLTVFAVTLSTGLIWRGFASAREPTETTERAIPIAALTALRVVSEAAVDVQIYPGEAGQIRILRWMRWSKEKPTVSEDWDGRTLRLDASCPGTGFLDGPICDVEYQIMLPQDVDLEATTSAGGISVDDMAGDVRIDTVSGRIHLSDLPGALHARSGSGSFWGSALRSERVDVEIGSGDLDLSFMKPPGQVRAIVRTSGDIRMDLPPAAYDVTASAPELIMAPDSDPASSRKITTSTPDGALSICC